MKESKKIYWITDDSFVDTDVYIVDELAKKNDIKWRIFNKKTGTGVKLSMTNFLTQKFDFSIIHLKHRFRNPKIIGQYMPIIKEIKRFKPDVIYIDFFGLPYFWLLVFLFLKRKNIVFPIHDFIEHHKATNKKAISSYKNMIYARYKNFHLFSQIQFELFKKKYPDKEAFMAPFLLKDFGKSEKQPPSNKLRFLFFGNIRRNKGLNLLIDAGNKLGEKYPGKFVIIIAGRCKEWEYYDEQIANKDNFEISIGPVPNEEIADLYCTSHYVMLPYVDVTQSGPLSIACNYNVPVIASNLRGFYEFVKDKETGYLFDNSSSKGLYDIMKKVIVTNNSGYQELKENFKNDIQAKYSAEAIVNSYDKFFNHLIKKN